jgi:hypothetical protein
MRTRLRTREVDGYIELSWWPKDDSEKEHRTLFYVSSESTPGFDVILGKQEAKLLQS